MRDRVFERKLSNFSVELEGVLGFGYFAGNGAEVDDLLDSFQALNSTCYILAESHFKEYQREKPQKIFSNWYVIYFQ